MDDKQPLLLRPAEAAKLLSISRSRCYELLAAGILPAIKIGGSVRVPARALQDWIAANTQAARGGGK